MVNVKFKLMENGKMPSYTREHDACLDCYSAEDIVIRPNSRQLVKLGFAMQLPNEYEAIIRPRSGNSKKGIDVAIGTVDSNYRGEVMANVINNSDEHFTIAFGDRICQLAVRPAPTINCIQVEELEDSNRGTNGFGSSGK